MSDLPTIAIGDLVTLMQRPIAAAMRVSKEVAELGPEPTDYLHIALLAADVYLDTSLTARNSLQELKNWVGAAARSNPTRYWNRMRVIVTALNKLQADPQQFARTEKIALLIMEWAYQQHRILPVDRVHELVLSRSRQLLLEMRGPEAVGC